MDAPHPAARTTRRLIVFSSSSSSSSSMSVSVSVSVENVHKSTADAVPRVDYS